MREELLQSQPADVEALARAVADEYGGGVAAVVFYGSCLRNRTQDGLIDLYVIVDEYPVAGMSPIGAFAARRLPPTVHHRRFTIRGATLRAKVAVISRRQMQARLQPDSVDTTLWARFCQPVALLYARDAGIVDLVAAMVTDAVIAAALWAARLGPDTGEPGDYWNALFRATYAAELRVERPERIAQIYAAARERYDVMLGEAWCALTIVGPGNDPAANPLPAASRRRAGKAWGSRRRAGRSLNAARLLKAAFTFDGGVDYVAWKIERHSGRRISLTGFQRKHPVLAAPSILWLLVRHRIVR